MKTASHTKRLKSAIVHACCYTLLLQQIMPLAYAAPTGAEVTGGTGTISQSGNATTINQNSQNMSINWQSYNVGVDERVQYIQPNSSSVSLNRILSNNGSTIAGRIDANGRVILVNPNGIFFTPTSVLNVGSLIASGLDINANDFMNSNGQYLFNEIEGTSGTVTNSGLINAAIGGNVALIGKQVKNDGVIVANLGTVSLAAGKEAVLTFDNNGVLGVRVSKEILQSELGVDPAVINSGSIQAQGGKVLLTASQSQDIFSRAVNTHGIEQATSAVVNDDGSFTLGSGADVLNSGTIDTSTTEANQNAGQIVVIGENVTSSGIIKADAQQGNGGDIELHAKDTTLLTQDSVTSARSESNGKGGTVKVLGDKVGLFDQSTVDVSGANGGGQALIGGDYQGKNAAIRNANTTIVNRNTNIFADALENGDGGTVILWADGTTFFGGNIFVRGGAHSGNGGFVETSGKENLLFRGEVDRTAANGNNGLLLLDPRDINIVETGSNNNQVDDRSINFTDGGTSGDYTISAATLQTLLQDGDVTLQASRDINVGFAITATADASTTPNTFVLTANSDINLNAAISLTGINLQAAAGSGCTTSCSGHEIRLDASGQSGSITVNGANVELSSTGNIILEGDVSITNSGTLRAIAGGYFDNWFTNQNINTGTGAVSITANGAGTINKGSGNLTAAAFLGNISAGSLSVTATGNGTTTFGGAIQQSVGSAQNLAITGNATFNAGTNTITLDNAANVLAGTITLGPTPSVPPAAPVLGGNVTLRNSVSTTLGTVNAAMLSVYSDRNLTLSGPVTATGATYLNFGRSGADSTFSVNSTLSTGTGSLTIDGDNGADTFNIRTALTGTLNGTGGNDTFNIDAPLTGTVNGGDNNDTFNIAGSVTGTLNGDAGNDTFNITAAGVNITSVDGGSGNDTLAGHDQTNTWRVTGEATGTLNQGIAPNTGIAFAGIQNLAGGTGTDTFTFDALGTLGGQSGWIDGGGGTGDTLDLRNIAGPVTVQWRDIADPTVAPTVNTSATMTVARMDTITANPNPVDAGSPTTPTNTLMGDDALALSTWTIDGADSGDINGAVNFSGFHNLTGGNQNDTFVIAVNGAVTGSISGLIDGGGGAGINTYDQSQLAAVTVNLNTGVTGITRNNNLIGNNTASTLTGRNSGDTWAITDTNSGSVAGISFIGFNNLIGGTGDDTYNISANTGNTTYGSLTGTITDTSGSNQLNVNVTNINNLGGNGQVTFIGDGSDSVTVSGSAPSDWRGEYTPAVTTTLDRIAYTNAAGTTTFALNYQGASTVNDSASVANYRINGTDGNDIFVTGENSVQVFGRPVGVNYLNKANLTIDGGVGADNLVQSSGVLTFAAGPANTSLVLANIENVNNNAALNTNLGGLSLINSGPVTIREQDALTLGPITTANLIDITAGGALTSTAALQSTAAFNLRSTADISLTGNNALSGSLSLQQIDGRGAQATAPNNTITLNNTGPTLLTAINAGDLFVTSTGNITDTGAANGAINVTDELRMTTPGTLTLDHINRIERGSLTANEINLHTAAGIGSGGIFSPNTVLNTTTSTLNVRNDVGSVLIANNGPVSASVINQGDIRFTNEGRLTIRQLNANGGNQTPNNNLGGNIYLGVNNGSAVGNPATHFQSAPDIVAQNFFGNLTGDPRDMGESGRQMSVLVRNEFQLFADNAYIYYFGMRPQNPLINAVLFEFVDFQGTNQQLIELESLDEIDPAIFTQVRNYYHEDVAILMPKDQLLSEEEEEEGQGEKPTENAREESPRADEPKP